MTVDVTRMARNIIYRTEIEREIARRTGLSISFSDIADPSTFMGTAVDLEAINWEQIREHVRVGVHMLSKLGDPEQLTITASEFVEGTISEMRRWESARTASKPDSGDRRENDDGGSDEIKSDIVVAGGGKKGASLLKSQPELDPTARPFWILSNPAMTSKPPPSTWVPDTAAAGTELMVRGLRERLGSELDQINLQINHPGENNGDKRPRIVWMHHDINQQWVQWCHDKALVDLVSYFVFVSYWQRDRYLTRFGLPRDRCIVLRNATDVAPQARSWKSGPVWRFGYTSTPFRGLSVLLDAWERLNPANAELHIWSSMKLYSQKDDPSRLSMSGLNLCPGFSITGSCQTTNSARPCETSIFWPTHRHSLRRLASQ